MTSIQTIELTAGSTDGGCQDGIVDIHSMRRIPAAVDFRCRIDDFLTHGCRLELGEQPEGRRLFPGRMKKRISALCNAPTQSSYAGFARTPAINPRAGSNPRKCQINTSAST